MKFTNKAAAVLLSGAMVIAFAPAVPAAFAADTATDTAAATTTAETTGHGSTTEETATIESGTYTIPVSSTLGMFHMSDESTVVVKGDTAKVTVVEQNNADGAGNEKYDAIYLGKSSSLKDVDPSTVQVVQGTPTTDANGKIVSYSFTFEVATSELGTGVGYAPRYASTYVNKDDYAAGKTVSDRAGHFTGTSKDYSFNFDIAKATVKTVSLEDGTYTMPVQSTLGMFHMSDESTVVVKGDKATVTIVEQDNADAAGNEKYDAIYLGRSTVAKTLDPATTAVVKGTPTTDSNGKVVKNTFTFDVTTAELNSGVYYAPRYASTYVNKADYAAGKTSSARAGQFSGTSKDYKLVFYPIEAQKAKTPAKKAAKTFTVNVATVNAAAVKKAAKKAGATAKSATSITIGTKAKKISKGAFKGYKKVKTLTVKTKKLTKKSVKGSLKGSAVKTVKVPKAKKAAYKKIFTKANAGKKVTVK